MSAELDQILGTVEDYWAIVKRRRWWLLIPALVTWGTVWGLSWYLPTTYQSEALILLEQQNVPNQYVERNVTPSIQDRLQTISQQVLSRTRLQATIDKFQLYPDPHGIRILLDPGEPIDKIRRDIEIEMVPAPGHPAEYTAFKMRYTAKSPELAQQVNAELTSPFVNENGRAQEQLSEDTTSFLEAQLAEARTKMEEQEAKVAAFKVRHRGEMPSQLEISDQQILGGIQSQLQNSQAAVEAAKQHKLYVESMIRQLQAPQVKPGNLENDPAGSAGDLTAASAQQLAKELVDLRLRLQDLQQRYTDDYPDVVAMKERIKEKEKQKRETDDQLAVAKLTKGKSGNAADSGDAQNGSAASLAELQSQLKSSQAEIQNYQKRESELESQVSAYLARLNMAPETEQEFAAISRGLEEAKANYNSLLQKQMQSQLATSLEENQKGERFRVLDPPNLPKKHVGPNRFKFSAGGLLFGVFVGVGLVAILELTGIRIRREDDIKELVPSLVLVNIPHLNTEREERRLAMVQWMDFGAVTLLTALLAAGNVYAFFKR